MKATAATLLAALAVLAGFNLRGGASSAHAAETGTLATIEASFAPNRLGSRTAVNYAVHITGGEGGVPAAVRKMTVLLPAGLVGLRVEWPNTRGCSRARLQRRGVRGCPARSEIGSGQALIAWREAGQTVTEPVKLQEFVAPNDAPYGFAILGEGSTPIRQRFVVTVGLALVNAPYSASLEAKIPPLPTRPSEEDASLVSLSLTTGAAKQPRFSGRSLFGGMGLFVPSSCPASGFPWAAEVTFAGSSTQQASTATPCP